MSDDALKAAAQDLVAGLIHTKFDWMALDETALLALVQRLPHDFVWMRIDELRNAIRNETAHRAAVTMILKATEVLAKAGVRLLPMLGV